MIPLFVSSSTSSTLVDSSSVLCVCIYWGCASKDIDVDDIYYQLPPIFSVNNQIQTNTAFQLHCYPFTLCSHPLTVAIENHEYFVKLKADVFSLLKTLNWFSYFLGENFKKWLRWSTSLWIWSLFILPPHISLSPHMV